MKLISTLAEQDIHASGDELDVLERDIRLMLQNLTALITTARSRVPLVTVESNGVSRYFTVSGKENVKHNTHTI